MLRRTVSSTARENTKITTDDSKVAAFIIPTNEELVIARDTVEIVAKAGKIRL